MKTKEKGLHRQLNTAKGPHRKVTMRVIKKPSGKAGAIKDDKEEISYPSTPYPRVKEESGHGELVLEVKGTRVL